MDNSLQNVPASPLNSSIPSIIFTVKSWTEHYFLNVLTSSKLRVPVVSVCKLNAAVAFLWKKYFYRAKERKKKEKERKQIGSYFLCLVPSPQRDQLCICELGSSSWKCCKKGNRLFQDCDRKTTVDSQFLELIRGTQYLCAATTTQLPRRGH